MRFPLLIALLVATTQGSDDGELLSVKSVKCQINEDFVFKNFSCFAKSYNRNSSTINVKFYFMKPYEQLSVRFELTAFGFKKNLALPDKHDSQIQIRHDLSRSLDSEADGLVWRNEIQDFSRSRTSAIDYNFQSWGSKLCPRMSLRSTHLHSMILILLFALFWKGLHRSELYIESTFDGKRFPNRRL